MAGMPASALRNDNDRIVRYGVVDTEHETPWIDRAIAGRGVMFPRYRPTGSSLSQFSADMFTPGEGFDR